MFLRASLLAAVAAVLLLLATAQCSPIQSTFYQGDIKLTAEQAAILNRQSAGQRTGVLLAARWPNATVPVHFTGDLNGGQIQFVENSLRSIEAVSCVRFVNRTDEVDFVEVSGENPGDCWSRIGRIGGAQELNLNPTHCIVHRTVVHEFLHALGFHHMHSSFKRDSYVDVQWDNIVRDMLHNFIKFDETEADDFGQAYDIHSVLHYQSHVFSRNGLPTIIPKNVTQLSELGDAPDMTTIDIARLNAMYCRV